MWVAFHPDKIPRLHSTTGDIVRRSLVLPGVFPWIVHHTYSWVSAVTWGLSRSQCREFCQFTYPWQWNRASSPNAWSSQILCDLAFQKKCNSAFCIFSMWFLYKILHIIYGWNFSRSLFSKHVTVEVQYQMQYFSPIVVDLLRSWQVEPVDFLERPALSLSETLPIPWNLE